MRVHFTEGQLGERKLHDSFDSITTDTVSDSFVLWRANDSAPDVTSTMKRKNSVHLCLPCSILL